MTATGNTSQTERITELARRVLPGGGLGNVAYDIVIAKGRGSRVWDVDGREYVDYIMGSGPLVLGHSHPDVLSIVQDRVQWDTTFFVNNEDVIQLAADIVDAVSCAEQVRFTSTGTEAASYAMRLARAYTRRDKILKFEGGFHGMSDYALMSLAPRTTSNYPRPVTDSAGIPKSIEDEILVAPYNDLETVASIVGEYRDELAGIMVEPLQRIVPPRPGFLEGLRELATENNLLLIFDEIVTGFRLAYGGGQAYYGVIPDLCTLGKAIGGGFPLAAIAGRTEIMAHFDGEAVPAEAFVPQMGTLSGNPIAAAAGRKTLEVLRRAGVYEQMFRAGQALMDGFTEILHKSGIEARVSGVPPKFEVVFTDKDVTDYRASLGKQALSKRCDALLRERGILKDANKFYLSAAHTEEDTRVTLDAFAYAISTLRREGAA